MADLLTSSWSVCWLWSLLGSSLCARSGLCSGFGLCVGAALRAGSGLCAIYRAQVEPRSVWFSVIPPYFSSNWNG